MHHVNDMAALGVKFYDGVQVNWVDVADGKVAGVKTNKGDIECEIFVNCAGQASSNHNAPPPPPPPPPVDWATTGAWHTSD